MRPNQLNRMLSYEIALSSTSELISISQLARLTGNSRQTVYADLMYTSQSYFEVTDGCVWQTLPVAKPQQSFSASNPSREQIATKRESNKQTFSPAQAKYRAMTEAEALSNPVESFKKAILSVCSNAGELRQLINYAIAQLEANK